MNVTFNVFGEVNARKGGQDSWLAVLSGSHIH